MATLADEFRAEAKVSPGRVVGRRFGGWSFCLSYGAVNAPEVAEAIAGGGMRMRIVGQPDDVTDKVIERLRAVTPDEMAEAERELAGEWMLSAKTIPPGREPTEKDLAFLGRTLVALHVPGTVVQEERVVGTRSWVWRDS